MSRKIIFLIVGFCLVGTIAIFMVSRSTEKIQAGVYADMYQIIDEKALTAQNGQQNSLSDLIDAIFIDFDLSQLNPDLVASLKDRIIRAEQNGQVIEEYRIVQATNWLTEEFSAPDYAKTSPLQTRVTRVKLGKYLPNFFIDKDNQGNIGLDRSLNSEISSNYSSTQSVYLLLTIIQQKMINEDYLKVPSQWDSDFYASEESETPNNSGYTQPTLVVTNSQKINEMHQVLISHNLTDNEADRLVQGALDQLGIPR